MQELTKTNYSINNNYLWDPHSPSVTCTHETSVEMSEEAMVRKLKLSVSGSWSDGNEELGELDLFFVVQMDLPYGGLWIGVQWLCTLNRAINRM